jgi:hypothetical protein
VRVACDRLYLLRAAKLAFDTVRVAEAGKPVACRDGQRTYAWMPLDADAVVGPSADTVTVTPPVATNGTRMRTDPGHGARTKAAPAPMTNRPSPAGGLIEEAVAVREALRDLLGKVRGLIDAARRQRQQHRLVKSTLASLKQLQHSAG